MKTSKVKLGQRINKEISEREYLKSQQEQDFTKISIGDLKCIYKSYEPILIGFFSIEKLNRLEEEGYNYCDVPITRGSKTVVSIYDNLRNKEFRTGMFGLGGSRYFDECLDDFAKSIVFYGKSKGTTEFPKNCKSFYDKIKAYHDPDSICVLDFSMRLSRIRISGEDFGDRFYIWGDEGDFNICHGSKLNSKDFEGYDLYYLECSRKSKMFNMDYTRDKVKRNLEDLNNKFIEAFNSCETKNKAAISYAKYLEDREHGVSKPRRKKVDGTLRATLVKGDEEGDITTVQQLSKLYSLKDDIGFELCKHTKGRSEYLMIANTPKGEDIVNKNPGTKIIVEGIYKLFDKLYNTTNFGKGYDFSIITDTDFLVLLTIYGIAIRPNECKCDYCSSEAIYDGKSPQLSWYYGCALDFSINQSMLGLGKGQLLIPGDLFDEFIEKLGVRNPFLEE